MQSGEGKGRERGHQCQEKAGAERHSNALSALPNLPSSPSTWTIHHYPLLSIREAQQLAARERRLLIWWSPGKLRHKTPPLPLRGPGLLSAQGHFLSFRVMEGHSLIRPALVPGSGYMLKAHPEVCDKLGQRAPGLSNKDKGVDTDSVGMWAVSWR